MSLFSRLRPPRATPTTGPEPSALGGVVIPSNAMAWRGTVYGPPPIAGYLARSLDLRYMRTPAGIAPNGLRGQDKSNPYSGESYRGDLGPLQAFHGAAWLAAFMGTTSGGIRPGLNTALPGTNSPPMSPVQRLLAALGQYDQNSAAHRA